MKFHKSLDTFQKNSDIIKINNSPKVLPQTKLEKECKKLIKYNTTKTKRKASKNTK